MEFDRVLETIVKRKAEEAWLVCGWPPMVRTQGAMRSLATSTVSQEDLLSTLQSVCDQHDKDSLAQHGAAEFTLNYGNVARFRVTAWHMDKSAKGVAVIRWASDARGTGTSAGTMDATSAE